MVASVFDYGAIKRRMMELTGEIPSGNHFDMQGNKIAAPSIPIAPEYSPDNLAATYKAIQARINECDQRRVRELATDLYKPTAPRLFGNTPYSTDGICLITASPEDSHKALMAFERSNLFLSLLSKPTITN